MSSSRWIRAKWVWAGLKQRLGRQLTHSKAKKFSSPLIFAFESRFPSWSSGSKEGQRASCSQLCLSILAMLAPKCEGFKNEGPTVQWSHGSMPGSNVWATLISSVWKGLVSDAERQTCYWLTKNTKDEKIILVQFFWATLQVKWLHRYKARNSWKWWAIWEFTGIYFFCSDISVYFLKAFHSLGN